MPGKARENTEELKIALHTMGVQPSEALSKHVTERLTTALDQHRSWIREVVATLRDENGPKGGLDKVCDLRVLLASGKDINVSETGADIYITVSAAADRLRNAVGRQVDKAREKSRG